MPTTRIVMIGGFLGAGKTTAISRLARTYQQRGHRVAIITNDHAGELVDTHNLRSQGLQVEEIAGGCFCGNMETFMASVERFGAVSPDLVLVEPIGSCVDLASTVIRPLRQQFEGRFEIAPFCVLVKPNHVLKILRGQGGGYSPKAEYLFRKQLEEADLIAINRADLLSPSEAKEISLLLTDAYKVPVVLASARSGQGFDALVELLNQQGEFGERVIDVDYQEYAAAEAELSWLNGSFLIRSANEFDLDAFTFDFVENLRTSLAQAGADIAHLKVVGLGDNGCSVVNLVSNDSPPEISLAAINRMRDVRLVVNARVATEPGLLSALVRQAIVLNCARFEVEHQETSFQCFRPGQPMAQVHSIALGRAR